MKFEFVEYMPKSWPPVFGEEYWTKRKCFNFKGMEPVIDRIQDFEVRDDDVWIVTLPKAGTTWMQEMVWLILNSFDFDTALSVNICNRSPFIELGGIVPLWDTVSAAEMLKSPRLIKTHTPLPLLPQQVWSKRPKVIYVFRHPKDMAISSYYHGLSLGLGTNCTLEQYLKDYIEEENWFFEHALEFWWLRREPNIFYMSFERMKKDLPNVILDVCNFLGVKINAEQLERLEKHLSFESMKNNICCSHEEESSELREYHRQRTGVSKTEFGGTISHWDTVSATEMLKSPRLIKTHIPLPLLPQQVWSKRPKVIYVFRHPKDVAISLYYHRLSLGRWINCTLEQHLEDYIEEENWFFEHALEFWWLRHEPNVFYTSFERMKKDLPNVIQDVCNFLGVKINAEQLERLEKHLSFESMKNNICCSHEEEFSELREYYRQIAGVSQTEYSVKKYPFIRKGQAGGYKHIFTSELNEKYDRWIEERLKPHNVTLDDLLLRNAPSSYKI